MNSKLFAWYQTCNLAATCIISDMTGRKSAPSKEKKLPGLSVKALSSRVERGSHTENHWKSISCACCCLGFISARLCRIRYPLMERKGSICQRPVTLWIQRQQNHIGSRLNLAGSYILSRMKPTNGRLEDGPSSWRPEAFCRQISSPKQKNRPFLPFKNELNMEICRKWQVMSYMLNNLKYVPQKMF